MTCDARIRPFPNDTEVWCDLVRAHDMHKGTLLDYAYEGSKTILSWAEGDRRTFHGGWPGPCSPVGLCSLPLGHSPGCVP